MNLRQLALVAIAALAVGGTAAAQAVPQSAPPTPPPPQTGAPGNAGTPVPVTGTPVPTLAPSASPTSSPAGRRGRGRSAAAATPTPEPGASETPAPPQFQTLDGVWEVQLQPLTGTGQTIYSHLYVTQKGDQISGHWTRNNNQKIPFTGTFDGRLFEITAKDAKNDYTMSGYIENFSDAVGMLKSGPTDQGTPFTASHRKKEKFEAM